MRDTELKELVRQVHTDNCRFRGARKIRRELNRRGHAVARRTVERLMREPGIAGAIRGEKVAAAGQPVTVELPPDSSVLYMSPRSTVKAKGAVAFTVPVKISPSR
ncbi:IS3 family transposase [Streptomyces zinciresistens]|uniref:IS3 family transposase n=1 Tax=Streptomyces zinciresistens TaxID=1073330 RepID=UPI000A30DD4F